MEAKEQTKPAAPGFTAKPMPILVAQGATMSVGSVSGIPGNLVECKVKEVCEEFTVGAWAIGKRFRSLSGIDKSLYLQQEQRMREDGPAHYLDCV